VVSDPNSTEEQRKNALRSLFGELMSHCKGTESSPIVSQQLSRLVQRLQIEQQPSTDDVTSRLVLRLKDQYPDDIGIFVVYFLNILNLKPGEAIFLGADEPHAYISGDIIECMATSDNVVRAGLTPKLKDVPTLVSMLTYNSGFPFISTGTQVGEHISEYKPPVDEFRVHRLSIPLYQTETTFSFEVSGPSILLLLSIIDSSDNDDGMRFNFELDGQIQVEGVSHSFEKERCFFLPSSSDHDNSYTVKLIITLPKKNKAPQDTDSSLLAFVASCNLKK